ncbi:hypothetical protein [Leisingera sp. NJS204]|uniref:hypothetical protein n=1 Tax=Leisingera sp. NJS204 TaxID=2508307 RepID=UPI0019801E1D|nr:hypothetical protein [Leisingera sp. NJS204]
MSSTKNVRRVRKLDIPKSSIQNLPEETIAVLAALSFAISEVNALWRMYDSCKFRTTGNEDVDSAISIQQNLVLRIWSAKIFELSDELDVKIEDVALKDFLTKAKEKLLEGGGVALKSIVRNFRHETTNHLNVSHIKKKHLGHVSTAASTSFYFDERDANSYFPFGEEVVFAGCFNRTVGSRPKGERLPAFADWVSWILRASKALMPLFDEFLQEFVFKGREQPSWQWIELELRPGMIAGAGEQKVPLIIVEEAI